MSAAGKVSVRDRPDACPGALRTHRAVDGLLVRLRLPGGRITSMSARGLAGVAERHGDGAVHLTSRGNVQLRGVREVDGGADPALVADVRACGLLPSLSHELVRNVVASPLSGLIGGRVDVGPLVAAVDHVLCADTALATLPGRFLVALDDGTGDVAGLDADLTWWAQDDGSGALLVGGVDTGWRVPPDRVPSVVVEVAHEFLRARGDGGAWHVGELPEGAAGFAELLGRGRGGAPDGLRPPGVAAGLRPPGPAAGLPVLGAVRQDDGRFTVAALVSLGRLESQGLRLLADLADLGAGRLVVTPWREIVLPGVAPEHVAEVAWRVAAAGLVTEPASPWRRVTACVGRPSCGRALADVRTLAAQTVEALSPDGPVRVHLAGCERRCGRPSLAHREVVATSAGCEVADVGPVSSGRERSGRPLALLPADVPAALSTSDTCTRTSEDK